ncbi:MAG: hypothetical protein FWD25_12840 [Clostridia bacterium]|nr:hypothetical protein [Clostridia bacterium]
MREFFLAVDGGGSKTEFCLYDCATGEARHFYSGSTNYKISEEADADLEAFGEGVMRTFMETGVKIAQIRGLVMGMAGVDSPKDYEHYLHIGMSIGFPKERIHVCNDSELAFYSKGAPPGLCIIAGTGSVSLGVSAQRQMVRSGGWGSPISDEGSGGWIGIRILGKLLRYCDGYDKHLPVFDDLRTHFGASSFEELPHNLSLIGMREIAGAARVVLGCADAGDPYCLELVHQAAFLAAEMGCSVYAKLAFAREPSVDVVMAGSLFKSLSFREKFMEEIQTMASAKNLRFCEAVSNPVLGGIALAKALFA